MKIMTVPYKLTLCLMITLFKNAIIASGKVNFKNITCLSARINQLLFGAYDALNSEGKMIFEYGDNELCAINKIANGVQNVGYNYRDLILYGVYDHSCTYIKIDPISPEKIKYIFDNYMLRSEVVNIINVVQEVIINDPQVTDTSLYLELLKNKREAEFMYEALVKIAILGNIKKAPVDEILSFARHNRLEMSDAQVSAFALSNAILSK